MKPWQSLTISILVHAAILSLPIVAAINMPYRSEQVRFIVIGGGSVAGNRAGATARRMPAPDVAGKKPVSRPQVTPPAQPKAPPVVQKKPAVVAKSTHEFRPVKKSPARPRNAAVHPKAFRRRVSHRHKPRQRLTPSAPALRNSTPPAKAAPAATSSAKLAHLGAGSGSPAEGTAHTPTAAASASGGPIRAEFGAANGPRFIHQVKPDYPRLARRLGKEGTVLLRVTIDQRGRPIHVQVVKGAGYGFDDQARRAVQDSLFAPARDAGRAVCCKVLLPVRFVLRSSP